MNGDKKNSGFGRILAWSIYDFANTIYSMNVVSLYFPLLITDNLKYPVIYCSVVYSLSMFIVAFLGPILGHLTDVSGRRMPSLIASTVVCCIATAAIGALAQLQNSPVIFLLVAFVIANVGYRLGLVFYDSLLPSVAPPESFGKVSGFGVALGYLGSIFGMILVMPFNEGAVFGIDIPFIPAGGRPATFIPTAILFFIFAIPTFIWVRERKEKPKPSPEHEGNPFKKILETLRDTKKYPGIRRFLIGKFLYEEGVETAILFMGVYAQKAMGLGDSAKLLFFVIATTGAAFGSVLFGNISDRLGARRTLNIVLAGWSLSLVILVFVSTQVPFFILGIIVGALLGGVWTSSRPLLIELAPPECVGRFFGLYALSGKMAAIVGPLVWGGTVELLSRYGEKIAYRGGVLALALLIFSGLMVLLRLKHLKKQAIMD